MKTHIIEDYEANVTTFMINWNIIKLCYELWRDEIMIAWNGKIKLHEIAGVSENYINEICAGRKKTAHTTFGAEGYEERLAAILIGKEKLCSIPLIKRYIVINNMYNHNVSVKRQKKEEDIIETICDEKDKTFSIAKETVDQLKQKIMSLLAKEPLLVYGEGRKTSLGLVKDYLLGKRKKGNREDIQYLHASRLTLLYRLIYEMDCDTIEKMDDKQIQLFEEGAEVLYKRLKAIREYREVRKADAQLTLKAALKIDTLTPEQTKAADVNKDNSITLADAQKILKVALKIETLE